MSKFTKALDKTQKERDDDKDKSKLKKNVFEAAGQFAAEEPLTWTHGIPMEKNVAADPRVVMQRFPNSMAAEQYRMLRMSLKTQLQKEGAKVILVSSSVHGEGKTVTCANLSTALAENGDARVIVIDADLRRGKLGEYMGFGNKRLGLSNLLSNGLHAKQIMVRNYLDNLVVIPRGDVPKNPSELVSSTKFQVLIAELRNHFDYILIDSPPIMSVADAGILGKEADAMVMIIQLGRTPKSVISHANLLFKQSGLKMLGYILTNVEFHAADYRYHQGYYYYGENEEKTGLKHKTRFQIKKMGWNFRNLEEGFNLWWEQKVLKSKRLEKMGVKKVTVHPGEMEPVSGDVLEPAGQTESK